MKFKYNLQFFADDTTPPDDTPPNDDGINNEDVNINDVMSKLSELSEQVTKLEEENKSLRNTNTKLLLQQSTTKPEQIDFGKELVDMLGWSTVDQKG